MLKIARNLSRTGIFFILAIGLLSCVSEQEKEERRRDAFDLEGQYKIGLMESAEIEMDFTITNENSVRSDIYITLMRKTPLTERERRMISSHRLSVSEVESQLIGKAVVLESKFRDNNISVDNGETSQFSVCSKTLASHSYEEAGVSKTSKYSVCISGVVVKATKSMNGSLISQISVSSRWEDQDSEEERFSYEYDDEVFGFSSGLSESFMPRQYIGTWIGEVFEKERSNSISQIVGLRIRNVETNEVAAYPLYRVVSSSGSAYKEQAEINFAGGNYRFETITDSYEELRDESYPIIRMAYKSVNDNKRLLFVGSVWSLGTFSGNILLLENGAESEVGSFRFKKD